MIDKLFDNLDRWRHLPDYQLERRADVFFSVYLHAFLSERFNAAYSPTLVPEFPLRKGTLWPQIAPRQRNLSVKVDYALFAPDHALFVELKTDAASRRSSQDEYLDRAKELGLRPL